MDAVMYMGLMLPFALKILVSSQSTRDARPFHGGLLISSLIKKAMQGVCVCVVGGHTYTPRILCSKDIVFVKWFANTMYSEICRWQSQNVGVVMVLH